VLSLTQKQPRKRLKAVVIRTQANKEAFLECVRAGIAGYVLMVPSLGNWNLIVIAMNRHVARGCKAAQAGSQRPADAGRVKAHEAPR
jgi:hypothetical protein